MCFRLAANQGSRFESSLNKLIQSNKIRNKHINELSNNFNNIQKTKAVSNVVVEIGMAFKNPTEFNKCFSALFNKLDAQNSKMHQEKKDKLTNLQNTLRPYVNEYHKAELRSTINIKEQQAASTLDDIASKEKHVDISHGLIGTYTKNIKNLEDDTTSKKTINNSKLDNKFKIKAEENKNTKAEGGIENSRIKHENLSNEINTMKSELNKYL